jgi:hypothetical protein
VNLFLEPLSARESPNMHVAAVAKPIFKFSSKHSAASRMVLLFLH